MKKPALLAVAFAAAALLQPAFAADAAFDADELRAIEATMPDVAASLRGFDLPDTRTVAVFPIAGDRGRALAGSVKAELVKAGKRCAEGDLDPAWKTLVDEFGKDEHNAALVPEGFLSKIGTLTAADVLVYGRVRNVTAGPDDVSVEYELHAADVKTKRILWSGVFSKRLPRGVAVEKPVPPARQSFTAAERKAIAEAMSDVSAALRIAPIPTAASVSVLPLAGDKGETAASGLKVAATDAGKTYVEGKEDPMWAEVLKEMAFDERNGGLLDEKTLVKIGSLKATDVLLYGTVRAASAGAGASVELVLHATDVKTKKHLWGGRFDKTWSPVAARAPFDDDEREAIAHAMEEVVAALKGSKGLDGKAVSILPVRNDSGDVVYSYLKNAVVSAGKRCVEHKDDPMWNEVVAEMVFDDRNGGLLDEKTLVRFGSLKATDVLLYGTLRSCTKTGNRVLVELDLHATDVATKEVVWNIDVFKRWYTTGTDVAEKGLSDIPQPVRARLADTVRAKLVDSLKAEKKLKAVQSIVLTPLTGDDDLYCSHILRDAITKSGFLVGNDMDRSTFQGAKPTDTVAYGEVRRLDFGEAVGFLDLFRDYQLDLDLQSAISQNEGRSILWSDTIQDAVVWRVWNWPKIVLFAVGVLVVLWIVRAFLRAATRVR